MDATRIAVVGNGAGAVAAFAIAILLVCGLAACGSNPKVARIDQCHEQVTLSLAPGVVRTERVIDGLQDEADVRLEYLRSSSPNLFVYSLSTPVRDPGCASALSRLRQDSRVRFVEPDSRRTVRGFAQ